MSYLNEQPIAQGEITFFPVSEEHFDGVQFAPAQIRAGSYVVAHSESGNDHILDMTKAEVSVVLDGSGMSVLRVLVTSPDAEIVNLSPSGHARLPIPPRLYEARINRELGMDDVIRSAMD